MSTTAKTGIALVLILAMLVIGWVLVSDKSTTDLTNDSLVQTSIAPTPTPKLPNTAGTGLSDETDISNEAIDTDLKAVGNQLNDLTTDNTNIDQSLKEVI